MEQPIRADEPTAMWRVPLADVLVDHEILGAVHEATGSGWWSTGARVEEFEQAFASYVASRHAIAVANGTAAIHLALLAVGCRPGDEVVLPSLNFVAAANAVSHTGARPVFCDIVGASDLNLQPRDVESCLTDRTKAVLVLHYGGYCCDIDAVLDAASRLGIVVIEDAAHAPGASSRGRMCGTFGNVGCFSFFSNKNLPVGEGGMVVTDDDELADRVRLLRSHGMTTLSWSRYQGHADGYDVVARGHNYRFDELRAAIGLVQLGRLRDANKARGEIVARYRGALHNVAGMTMPFEGHAAATSAHHLAVLVLPSPDDRAVMREHLGGRGVQTSLHYPPIHQFSEYSREPCCGLAMTDDVANRLITLPLFPHMTEHQVELVVDAVLECAASSLEDHT